MSNPLSKVCIRQLPGNLFLSAINETHLAIESRDEQNVFFSVIDLANGELVAELSPKSITPWHSLLAIQDEYLILQYFENKKNPDTLSHFSLNLTDEKLEEIELEDFENMTIRAPAIIPADSSEFETVKQFIGEEIVLGCEYDEFDNNIITSYYRQHSGDLTRHLMVLCDGEVNYHEIQDSNLKGFAPGSFFTCQNRLIFVREKTEINIYEI